MFAFKFGLDREAEQAHMLMANQPKAICHRERYNVFALRSSLMHRAGMFDENAFPAYFEDTEWEVRLGRIHACMFKCVLAYVDRPGIPASMHAVSGKPRTTIMCKP